MKRLFQIGAAASLALSALVPGARAQQMQAFVYRPADLSVRATLEGSGPYRAGDNVRFSVYVNNRGAGLAEHVSLDQTPTNLTQIRPEDGCAAFPCPIVDLGPQATATFRISAVVAAPGRFELALRVSSRRDDPTPDDNQTRVGGEAEPEPGGVTVKPVLKATRTPVADLSVAIAFSRPPAILAGKPFPLPASVTNQGPDPARQVSLSLRAENLTLMRVSGDCTTLSCELPGLAPRQTAHLTLLVAPTAPGTFSATLHVTHAGEDPVSGNNRAAVRGYAEPVAPPPPRWPWYLGGVGLLFLILAAIGLMRARAQKQRPPPVTFSVGLEPHEFSARCSPLQPCAPEIRIRVRVEAGSAQALGIAPMPAMRASEKEPLR